MSRADNNTADQHPHLATVSVLPPTYTARAGGAELSAVEQQLIEDFRQMESSARTVMVRFFQKTAGRAREERIAENKPKFQVLRGGAL